MAMEDITDIIKYSDTRKFTRLQLDAMYREAVRLAEVIDTRTREEYDA